MPIGAISTYRPSAMGPRVHVDPSIANAVNPHPTSKFINDSKEWGSWFFWGYNREVNAMRAEVQAPGASVRSVAEAVRRVVTYSDDFFPVDFFVDERSKVKSWCVYFENKVTTHGHQSWRAAFSGGPVEMETQTEVNPRNTVTMFASSGSGAAAGQGVGTGMSIFTTV